MMEREISIMLNATAELNRKEKDDLFIPVRASEYRQLIHDCADLAAQLKVTEEERISASAERYHLRDQVKKQDAEIAELKKKLAEIKGAAE